MRLVATKAQDGEMLKNFEQNEGKFLFSEEERRRLITQRTQAEVEVELSAARQKMGSNPESANHDLKAMLEQVERIVEIDADVRSQLRIKIESAIRESGRRAAVEEGVVAGGGVALLRAKQAVGDRVKGDNVDQDAGIKLVLKAIEAPLREIVANAGGEPSVVINKVLEGKGNFGYNAANDTYGDMIEMGILDPTKVTRTALQNAASIGALILTTEAIVSDKPEKAAPAAPAGGPDMGGMDF